MHLIDYQSSHLPAILNLFRTTVHTINSKDYTKEQLEAWAPEKADLSRWEQSLSRSYTQIAINDNNEILGFANLDKDGLIDYFYVAAHCQGEGIGKMLMIALLNHAENLKFPRLFTFASSTASGFFIKIGFRFIQSRQVHLRGQVLTNHLLEKLL
jgi:N-acetylglutamate synthase-like GNAT family acetyltransferase